MVAERRLQVSLAIIRAAVSDPRGVVDLVLNPDHPADHRLPEASGAAAAGRPIERVRLTTIDDEVGAHAHAPMRAAGVLAPLPPRRSIDVLFARRRAEARP